MRPMPWICFPAKASSLFWWTPRAHACRASVADAVVDAVLAKRNLGTTMDMAPIVVGVGPGFTAGVDCHAVVETMRGHTLGRAYYEGSALPNTAVLPDTISST